jgi:hydroxymethylbilane synthase
MSRLVIGTRGSPLALAQSNMVRAQLQQAHPGLVVELKIIKTSGDIFQAVSMAAGGGKGFFTKEIEEQLLRGEIQLAVHSLKDLPTQLPAGLGLGAVPVREDPHDVLVSRQFAGLDQLPQRARVATSSVRRKAQLLARRPDLLVEEIRGNVETRLRRLNERPDLAATILAAAGLKRLGLLGRRDDLHWHSLDFDVMIPAVGQGLIGIEIREDDRETRDALAPLNDAAARACGDAERAFLRRMGGGCQVPFAAYATVSGEQLELLAGVFSPDGASAQRIAVSGSCATAEAVGEQAADKLK